MGHRVEALSQARGHEIVARIDAGNVADTDTPAFRSADVAIEFSTPSTAVDGILRCFAAGVPVVVGTTGWQRELPELRDMCLKGAGTLLYSSNFSIGVNLFRAVNRYLASLIGKVGGYEPSVSEVHHIHKLDHPSGTAVTIAEDILSVNTLKGRWAEPDADGNVPADALPISHERRGEVPGIHEVTWRGADDMITLRHEAFSRDGFALGAVMAAEWLRGRSGFFTIDDMLGFQRHTTA